MIENAINKFLRLIMFIIGILIFNQCSDWEIKSLREEISLDGLWYMQLDNNQVGVTEKWYLKHLSDSVTLPGTLDENGKGYKRTDSTYAHLNRPVSYTGKAWYKKVVNIPDKWKNKDIRLILERTKVTDVWVDSTYIGGSKIIFSPQYYNLTGILLPGEHTITIAVDNCEELVPVAGSHAYSEDTQTNWNGIIGKFALEASYHIRIKSVKVTPDIDNKSARIKIKLKDRDQAGSLLAVSIRAKSWNTRHKHKVPMETFIWSSDKNVDEMEFVYKMGDEVDLWSEFDPALYKLEIVLNERGVPIDNKTINFGMREFKTHGTKFTINNKITFLRGKHDACVFPLTGYPPMDVKEWVRVFKIAQDYGINHYRFHSWTPPEAAFKAADICGIYIQSELPMWWGFNAEDKQQIEYLINSGRHILDEYANYASFDMFALGNELYQDRNVLKEMVDSLRLHDSRPLFAQGSNNRLWAPLYADGDDFFVSFRSAADTGGNSSDIRASISFLDSKNGGILNAQYPSTTFNYTEAIKSSPVPMIGHEIGQYQVYPNFSELKKYKGVLKPWNLELFKKDLIAAGMFDQVDDFFEASGKLAAICYKADIEAAIRTPGFGGFQLLDLQDYPGQGTALVGMLDAFMENKGIIKPEEFREFCDEIVVLADMEKYCWLASETFTADIVVANYSRSDINDESLQWELMNRTTGNTLAKGKITNNDFKQGTVQRFGNIKILLDEVKVPSQLTLKLNLSSGNSNEYSLWVYPNNEIQNPENVIVTNKLTEQSYEKLINGGAVLYFPLEKDIKDNSVGCQFISDFWNYKMFKDLGERYNKPGLSPGTMGLLMDPKHPAFKEFPTDFHTNWQWWPMTRYGRSLILDTLKNDYIPLVQVIDNINRNHKLSLISEFKVGAGKLLVCTANLPELTNYIEAKQLYISLLKYVASEDFNPEYELSRKDLELLGLLN